MTPIGSTQPMRTSRRNVFSMRPAKTTSFRISSSRSVLSSTPGMRVTSKRRSGLEPAQRAGSGWFSLSAFSSSSVSLESGFAISWMRSAPISASAICP
jgi:hypothetical protein